MIDDSNICRFCGDLLARRTIDDRTETSISSCEQLLAPLHLVMGALTGSNGRSWRWKMANVLFNWPEHVGQSVGTDSDSIAPLLRGDEGDHAAIDVYIIQQPAWERKTNLMLEKSSFGGQDWWKQQLCTASGFISSSTLQWPLTRNKNKTSTRTSQSLLFCIFAPIVLSRSETIQTLFENIIKRRLNEDHQNP